MRKKKEFCENRCRKAVRNGRKETGKCKNSPVFLFFEKSLKKTEKTSKKVLTKERRCVNIIKRSRERATREA